VEVQTNVASLAETQFTALMFFAFCGILSKNRWIPSLYVAFEKNDPGHAKGLENNDNVERVLHLDQ
jgi:hypothetical protein